MSLPTTFFLLLVGHALADYPLQGDFLARAKNHRAPLAGVPWPIALGAHALIHAGVVFAVTGSLGLAVAELYCHAVIDWAKCEGKTTLTQDQLLHVACKVGWAVAAWIMAGGGRP